MTAAPRIVSLLPSATEIVCALGFEPHLVGRSHECDFPPSVSRLPACSRPLIDTEGSSAAIDEQVKHSVRSALSVYDVLQERLAELAPDVIVTQTQCEVCAVSLESVAAAVADGLDSNPDLISLECTDLQGLWNDIARVGTALEAGDGMVSVVSGLQGRMNEIADAATGLSPQPTVACIEWIDPLMAAGTWVPELVEMGGGCDLFGVKGNHAPWLEHDTLRAADPDVIVLMPCGFGLERTRREAATLASMEGWSEMKAVREGRVAVTDGHQYFNRPGPRLVESLEIMAEILHPDGFSFGHRGRGWTHL